MKCSEVVLFQLVKWENLLALLCTTSWFFLQSKATCSAAPLHCIFQEKSNKGPWLFLNEIKALGKLFQPTPCLSAEMDFKYRSRISFLFYLPFFFSEIRSGCIPLIRDSQYGANWLYEMGFLNGTPDLFFFPLVFKWRSIYQIWGFCLTSLLRALNLYLLVYCISLRTKSTVLSLRDNILLLVASDIRSWLGLISVHAFVYVWSSEKQCVGEEEVWSCDSGNPDF